MTVPIPTPIYRITHVDNLQDNILPRDSIYAPNFAPHDGRKYTAIHYQHIQSRRSRIGILCGPGGTILDYVPFYFAPRSPMLYVINKGGVKEYLQGQGQIIYLVASAQSVAKMNQPFVFTDGHAAISGLSHFFDDLIHLDKIDWPLMKSKYWFDTDQDMDRKRRRQAEFLVYRSFPWTLVDFVAVINGRMKKQVETILAEFPEKMRRVVRIKQSWYY